MFRLNFRIGTKLGLAGGVALLTVGAIALNQSWDRQTRAELTAEADNVDAVRTATLTATVATRRVVIMGRDVRLAATAAEIDEALKKADAFTAAGVKAIDAAAAAAATAQSRQRFAHAKDVTGKYLAAIHELAAARKEILKSGGPMAAVLKDGADPVRVELDKILDEATADFNAQDAEIQGRIGAEQIRSRMVGLMLDAVVAMIIIGTIVFSFLGVSRPIARLNDAMEKMAKGDLDIDVPGAGRGDEIGDMAKTITVIRENAARAAIEKQEEAKREEAGRAGRRKANMQKLADEFENGGRRHRRRRCRRPRPSWRRRPAP